jgi:hypothetical protein
MTDEVGDYDKRGKDLWQAYAIFGRRTLPDDLHSALQLARQFSIHGAPEHGQRGLGAGFIGDKVWLRVVSGVNVYDKPIYEWSMHFAEALAGSYQLGKQSKRVIKSYKQAWGDEAACDGVDYVFYGESAVSVKARTEQYGLSYQPYTRLRTYVAGVLLAQAARFETDLTYALRVDKFS